jgi:hypothetical protein
MAATFTLNTMNVSVNATANFAQRGQANTAINTNNVYKTLEFETHKGFIDRVFWVIETAAAGFPNLVTYDKSAFAPKVPSGAQRDAAKLTFIAREVAKNMHGIDKTAAQYNDATANGGLADEAFFNNQANTDADTGVLAALAATLEAVLGNGVKAAMATQLDADLGFIANATTDHATDQNDAYEKLNALNDTDFVATHAGGTMFKPFATSVIEELILKGRTQGRNTHANALDKQLNPTVPPTVNNRKIVKGAGTVVAAALTFEIDDILEFTVTINHNGNTHTNNTVFRVQLKVIDDANTITAGKQLFEADSDGAYPS